MFKVILWLAFDFKKQSKENIGEINNNNDNNNKFIGRKVMSK